MELWALLLSFWGLHGWIHFFVFSAHRSLHIPGLMVSSCIFKASNVTCLCPSSTMTCSDSCLTSSLVRTLMIRLLQRDKERPRYEVHNLIIHATSHFLCTLPTCSVIYSQVYVLESECLWERWGSVNLPTLVLTNFFLINWDTLEIWVESKKHKNVR